MKAHHRLTAWLLAACLLTAASVPVWAQAHLIKGKAKDLKKKVESGNTNQAPVAPKAPAPKPKK